MSRVNPYAAPDSRVIPSASRATPRRNVVQRLVFVSLGFYFGVGCLVSLGQGFTTVGTLKAVWAALGLWSTHFIFVGVVIGHLLTNRVLSRSSSTPTLLSSLCGFSTPVAGVWLLETLRSPGLSHPPVVVLVFGAVSAACTSLVCLGSLLWHSFTH